MRTAAPSSRRPKTKPHLDEIEAAEAGMPGLAELEAQAAAQAEVVYVNL